MVPGRQRADRPAGGGQGRWRDRDRHASCDIPHHPESWHKAFRAAATGQAPSGQINVVFSGGEARSLTCQSKGEVKAEDSEVKSWTGARVKPRWRTNAWRKAKRPGNSAEAAPGEEGFPSTPSWERPLPAQAGLLVPQLGVRGAIAVAHPGKKPWNLAVSGSCWQQRSYGSIIMKCESGCGPRSSIRYVSHGWRRKP
jgi:hypothetical protein